FFCAQPTRTPSATPDQRHMCVGERSSCWIARDDCSPPPGFSSEPFQHGSRILVIPTTVLIHQEGEMTYFTRRRAICALASLLAVLAFAASAGAQGVTTAAMTGVVQDSQGAVVPGVTITATHVPSGTTYTGVTQSDG